MSAEYAWRNTDPHRHFAAANGMPLDMRRATSMAASFVATSIVTRPRSATLSSYHQLISRES
jgi:hypothetical protein